MYLRRFYFIILVYANLKMEYDTKDKTFWKRKGNDMKVLLGAVNAKYIHSNLAVYCLKAYAEKYGDTSDEISIGEYTINQQLDEILRDIYKRKPDMLCLSCYIWNLTYIEEICREIKKVMPQIIIWIGGPEVSYDGVKVLERLPEVDGVMKGEVLPGSSHNHASLPPGSHPDLHGVHCEVPLQSFPHLLRLPSDGSGTFYSHRHTQPDLQL